MLNQIRFLLFALPFSRIVIKRERRFCFIRATAQRENSFIFFLLTTRRCDSGMGFVKSGLPCQRFISMARGSRAMALQEERKSLINFEPRH